MFEDNLYFKIGDGSTAFALIGGPKKLETAKQICDALNQHTELLLLRDAAQELVSRVMPQDSPELRAYSDALRHTRGEKEAAS